MLKEEFKRFWNENFKETIPLNNPFREVYPNYWFRIHSLPESKRYAETEEETEIILSRQNQLISDIFKINEEIFLVRGEYFINIGKIENEDNYYLNYNFQKVSFSNLHKFYPDDFNANEKLNILVATNRWKQNKFNDLLTDIANDITDIFFVSKESKIIIAPYDGGMDIIFRNESSRNHFKERYKKWLSKRKDGL